MSYQIQHNAQDISLFMFSKLKCFHLVLLLLISLSGFSQSISDDFRKSVDSLINLGPRTYGEIDLVLNKSRNDSVLMRYFFKEAVDNNYLDGQAYALNQLGRKYRNTSQFSKALGLHQRAFEIAVEADNLEFRVYALNMLGVVHKRSDAILAALEYYQKALKLAETVKNPKIGLQRSMNVSLNGIGNIYKTLEQYEVSIEKFTQALILDEQMNNTLGLAINHFNIGECQESKGEIEEALQSFQTSLSYNEEINSERGKIHCNYSIAHVYVHMGRTNEALSMLQNALSKAIKLGDKGIISSVEINLGWAHLNLKQFKQSKNHLSNGLRIAENLNLSSQRAEANKFLSELAIAQNNYKDALAYYVKSQSLSNEISNVRNLRYVNDMIVRYENEKRENRLKEVQEERDAANLELIKSRTGLLIGGLAIALLAGILYILYRQYQLKNEKKLITLEQTMLRSQMNPHFLFNSLNSIKLYIINNEQKNAVHYLNKFSKLVRKILEASSLREIPLFEELETVELYMNIENIRFSNEIDFKIEIDESIDPHNIKVPSLILQPFLENALWHGLSSKIGDKKILLNVSKATNDAYIIISVTDNGIGRAASEKIKENKVLKRNSVGIDITTDRLTNFSKDYQNSFYLEILDLYHEDGTANGTKVILNIPMI